MAVSTGSESLAGSERSGVAHDGFQAVAACDALHDVLVRLLK